MKRYIAAFSPWTGGLYVVMEVLSATERYQIGDPKPYHDANDEAHERNAGTWGQPKPQEPDLQTGWLGGLNFSPLIL
jgi:hypothetical protein